MGFFDGIINGLIEGKTFNSMLKMARGLHSFRRFFRIKEKRKFKRNKAQFFERLERLLTALKLKIPDRIPISAPYGQAFPAKCIGYTPEEFFFNKKKSIEAHFKFIENFPADLIMTPFFTNVGKMMTTSGVNFIKLPGIDLDPNVGYQFDERELMKPEDYEIFGNKYLKEEILPELIDLGVKRPKSEKVSTWKALRAGMDFLFTMLHNCDRTEAYGTPVYLGSFGMQPFDVLSLLFRGLKGISIDIRRRPEDVKRICDKLAPGLLNLYLLTSKLIRRPMKVPSQYKIESDLYENYSSRKINTRLGCFFVCERSFMMNPAQFEEISFPSLNYVIKGMVDAGIVPAIAFEQDVTHLLPIIRKLPGPGKVMFFCDLSDINKAKEIIGDRMCIIGNVPFSLLTVGTPHQIDQYVKNLIDVFKGDGGFILGPALSIPDEARPENVKAMIDAGLKYGKY